MGRFNDLPKDVLWLIFRQVLSFMNKRVPFERYEVGYHTPNWFQMMMVRDVANFACINRQTLKVMRSKTIRCAKPHDWFFIKGSLI